MIKRLLIWLQPLARFWPSRSLSLKPTYLLFLVLAVSPPACRDQGPPPPPTPLIAPDKQAAMQEIRLTEVEEGEKRWFLIAKGADYTQEQNLVQLHDLQVEVYGRGDHNLTITAATGAVDHKSRQLTLAGKVKIQDRNYEITADRITYDPRLRQLSAPGPVQISGPRLAVQGRGLTLDLTSKKLTLAEHEATKIMLSSKIW